MMLWTRRAGFAWPLLLLLVAVALIYPVHDAAAATFNYQVCVKYQIDTTDSSQAIVGGPSNGLIEDQYQGCNSNCDVIARGVRIKVARPGWSTVLDTSPTTGCATFSFTDPPQHVYDITVYGYSTNVTGQMVRIHDAPNEIADGGDYYPGATYSTFLDDVLLDPGGGANTVFAGSYDAKWTAMAVAAFGLYRFAYTSSAAWQYHVGINGSACAGSTAHYNGNGYSGSDHESNSQIANGKHYIKLGACATGSPQARAKFVVAHELGHALLALGYGAETGAIAETEPASGDYSNSASTLGNYCFDSTSAYGINTKEWDAVAYREGFAHFVSARIWNNKAGAGAFRWMQNFTQDLERYGPAFNQTGAWGAGGLFENVCDGANKGAATAEDVLRFLWDFYNADSGLYCGGGQQPTNWDIVRIYVRSRLNGGLQRDNYASNFEAAAENVGIASCLAGAGSSDEYNYYQELHGVDY